MSTHKEVIFLFGVIVSSWIIATLAVWFAWHNQDKSGTYIYDVFFEILPDLSAVSSSIPNYIGFASMVIALISLENSHWGYLCQFLFLNSIILLLRSLTTTVTLLPNIHVYDYCKETPQTFFEVVEKQMEHGTCADYVFSGHTAVVFLMYMFTHRHKFNYAFEVVNGLLVVVMTVTLLLLRWHYTIDVVLAITIVFLVFKYYKDYENCDYWFYFPELKKLNLQCKPVRVKRTDVKEVNSHAS
jgi:hypothetical protein